MNARELKSRVLSVLTSGTRREQLVPDDDVFRKDDPKLALKALSFVGQALRFDPKVVPSQFVTEDWPRDDRRILPEALRAPILRLLDGHKCTEDTAVTVAWALEKRRLRPHPFDLPKMDAFVRRHAEHLGIMAQYWAQRDSPVERRQGYFDAEDVNEQSWTDAPLARRVKFLEELRQRDAAKARDMLKAAWARENAEARARLLAALQVALGTDDIAFLEGLAKDRAPRVKALAHRLLARLTGAAGDNPALAACVERIQKTKAGLLRRRIELKLELPATVKEHAANRWIQELFADVSLEELERALDVTESELVAAAEKDERLLFALALMASRERRFDLLEPIVDILPDAWGRMSEVAFDEVRFAHAGEKERWVETMVQPRRWMPEAPFPAWSWLLRRIEGPLPLGVMKEIQQTKRWFILIAGEEQPATEVVQIFCALCPAELRNRMREQIEPLEFERKDKGLLLMEILDRLEKV